MEAGLKYEYIDVAPTTGGGTYLSVENQFFLEDGSLVPVDYNDPRFTGRELLHLEALDWKGRRVLEYGEAPPQIISFYCGLIITDEVKEIFSEREVEKVQYIPLSMSNNIDGRTENAWYVHVFNWKEVFDLDQSSFTYFDWPDKLTGASLITKTLGDRPITSVKSLSLNPEEVKSDIFLARFPDSIIWERIYFSREFAQYLRAELGDGVLEKLDLDFERGRPSLGFFDFD